MKKGNKKKMRVTVICEYEIDKEFYVTKENQNPSYKDCLKIDKENYEANNISIEEVVSQAEVQDVNYELVD